MWASILSSAGSAVAMVPETVSKTLQVRVKASPPPPPRKHGLSADGTGKFYLDFELVQRTQGPLSPPQAPFPMSPPWGTLRVQ